MLRSLARWLWQRSNKIEDPANLEPRRQPIHTSEDEQNLARSYELYYWGAVPGPWY